MNTEEMQEAYVQEREPTELELERYHRQFAEARAAQLLHMLREKVLPGRAVREFHSVFGMPIRNKPEWVTEREELRKELILEEFKEFWDEIEARDLSKAAKEACDIIYVLHGMFAEFGVDLDAVFTEVHRSNMSKLWENGEVRYREDGKVLKPPTYSPADVEKVW